jgi:hypothetical protein
VGPREGVDLLGKRKYLASAEMNSNLLNTRYTEMLSQGIRPLVFGQLEFMLEHTLPPVISCFFSVPPDGN